MKTSKNGSSIKNGVRSPMNGFEQNTNQRMPSIGTTEAMRGTAPKAAKLSSPTTPKNPGKNN